MAVKITAHKITAEVDGWSLLSGRFRVHSAKCAPGLVVAPGPNASVNDVLVAQAPLMFTSLDEALAWLEPKVS